MAARRAGRKKAKSKRKPRKAPVSKAKVVTATGLAQAIPCTRRAVQKAIASGRLDGTWTKNSRGHYEIDLEKARAAWKEEASQDTVLGSPPGPDLGDGSDGWCFGTYAPALRPSLLEYEGFGTLPSGVRITETGSRAVVARM